ncbi:hypothetical protein GCM10027598_48370 [Amycolatopsis oliviviridis]|uniref:Coenzyme Q-binding protein COQ10 START domain-containing protein n=1 Tax=Amycolatopsis oliviviridis TaxID=1471590 RepID=A0ABQ3MCR0_9PSEU|nr:SRPBCC family protein [Amycolatopsis oliviviridis]GHH37990.1 hypothetical protein GCM10017790_83200 [Amycolatopsis oliviviridis]
MGIAAHYIEVEAPAQACYDWWRPLTRLPEIFSDVESVEPVHGENGHTRWRVSGPAGVTVEWIAKITEDKAPHTIAWTTVENTDPDVVNSGVVRFHGKGSGLTGVEVGLRYSPPAGKVGEAVASLLADPQDKVERACAEFKRIVETR